MRRRSSLKESFIEIDSEKCIGCGNCVIICGAGVYKIKNKKAYVANHEKCLECGNCEIVCPQEAIRVNISGQGIIYRYG